MPECGDVEDGDAIFENTVRAGAFVEYQLRAKPRRGDAFEIGGVEMKIEETLRRGADGDGALVGVHANSEWRLANVNIPTRITVILSRSEA